MADDSLDRVDEVTEGVTEGPWEVVVATYGSDGGDYEAAYIPGVVEDGACGYDVEAYGPLTVANARFIAASRTLVPKLRYELEEARDLLVQQGILGRSCRKLRTERDAALAEVERLRADHDPGHCFHCTRCEDADDSAREGYRLARAEVERLRGALNRGVIDASHIDRQRAFSETTFGPGRRTEGVVDHIRKELMEVLASPDDLTEWADVIILALDGAWRTGADSQAIIDAIKAKQARNEQRQWPDWRTAEPCKAIEHVRTPDEAVLRGDQ